MRLLTFDPGSGPRLGALDANDQIVDPLARVENPAFGSMQALIEGGIEALARLRGIVAEPGPVIEPHTVRWVAPLPVPTQMRDFVAFEQHMRMAGANVARLRARWGGPPAPAQPLPVPPIWYQQPLYYKCNRMAVIGPDCTVEWPGFSEVIDYELEIACVIGQSGRNISKAEAPRFIFGYTIFNDLTARDAQLREMQGPFGPAKGKDFDNANVMGPVIVTADEVDIGNLSMRARVNGEIWSDGSSSTMHWSFADLIAHVSQCETLYPGEVFGSGTVGGGCGLELGRFLKHNDVIELEVQGIGRLTTRIHAPHVPSGLVL